MVVDKTVFLADGVILSGEDIIIGKDSSVWYNSVLRCSGGNAIIIGERTNIQDLCMLHISSKGYSVNIGDGVTIGHSCIIHGCKIGNNTLVGMGSIIMNGATIGNNCIIGAGSLVTQGKYIPDGTLAFGRPAKIIRELTEEEIEANRRAAEKYISEYLQLVRSLDIS